MILTTKLVNDAGFDVEYGPDGDWLKFGVPGSALRAWVRIEGESWVAALSRADVLTELAHGEPCVCSLPTGAAGARRLATPAVFTACLDRARVLDRTLPDALLDDFRKTDTTASTTEAEALVRQRRGQELFRAGLLAYWGGRCAITGLDVPELLRASHAKPWKDATDAERLDVHNGLLLTAHLDAAFDQGLITVEDEGRVIPSPYLPISAHEVLGLNAERRITGLAEAHQAYLAWHRERVFRKD